MIIIIWEGHPLQETPVGAMLIGGSQIFRDFCHCQTRTTTTFQYYYLFLDQPPSPLSTDVTLV